MSNFGKTKAKLQGSRKRNLSDGQGAAKRKRDHTRQSGRHNRVFKGAR